MAIGIFVGESMGYRTTGLIDARFAAGADEDAHVDAIEEFAVEASIIKVFGSEVLDYCADECVQIHGGYGFIEEYQPERLLRDSRINRIFEGTNEINRLIVPATILKRAMKGQAPLIERAAFIRSSLAKGEVPRAGEGEFGVVSQVVEFCKWIATYVLAVAAETYHVHIADEQEILGELSDIISHVYALDSAVARVRLITEGKSEMSKVGRPRPPRGLRAARLQLLRAHRPPHPDGRLRPRVVAEAPRGHRAAAHRLAQQGHRGQAPHRARGPRGRRLPDPPRRLGLDACRQVASVDARPAVARARSARPSAQRRPVMARIPGAYLEQKETRGPPLPEVRRFPALCAPWAAARPKRKVYVCVDSVRAATRP